jgi:hypothetical protein
MEQTSKTAATVEVECGVCGDEKDGGSPDDSGAIEAGRQVRIAVVL